MIRMRTSYLPKLTIAILVVAAAIVVFSGQSVHVAASPVMNQPYSQPHSQSYSPQNYCYYYGYYNSSYYMNPYYYYYYGYPYNYYYYGYPYNNYCSYYSYYYPYYYGSYYYNYGYGYPYSYSYYNTPSSYQLTVNTDPSSLGTVSGGGTFTQGSSATFSVTQNIISVSPTSRYVFSHWSGDYSGVGTSGTLTMNSARKVTAVYQMQYYLTVSSQQTSVPAPQGAGWYNAGDTATVTSPGEMFGDSQSRLVFQGWSVDGQTAQSGSTLSVTMDAPHSAQAQYKQQYYLTVSTDQGVPYGQGWYDAGSTAQIYVSTPVSTSYGVSIVFNGWQGDLQSNSQSANVQMDKAKTVIASWRTDPTVLYVTVALVVVAVLLAAGIIAVLARGRPRSNTQVTQTTQTTQPSEPHHRKAVQHTQETNTTTE